MKIRAIKISYLGTFKGDNLQNQSNTKKSLQISFSDQKASARIFILYSNFFVFFSGHTVCMLQKAWQSWLFSLTTRLEVGQSPSARSDSSGSLLYTGQGIHVRHWSFYRSVSISKTETVRGLCYIQVRIYSKCRLYKYSIQVSAIYRSGYTVYAINTCTPYRSVLYSGQDIYSIYMSTPYRSVLYSGQDIYSIYMSTPYRSVLFTGQDMYAIYTSTQYRSVSITRRDGFGFRIYAMNFL